MEFLKDFLEKYYVFTLVFFVLAGALFYFQANKDVTNIIIGAFVGLISAPAILPKSNQVQ